MPEITEFERKRLTFALKRAGIATAADLQAWLADPKQQRMPPDERARRLADIYEAMPSLRPVDSTS